MERSTIRILVVDDYEPWLRFISSTLQKQSNLQVIGEVSDGLEAVRKAQELKPDLILLDIGLPTLNGIEAARQIRARAPKSKILIVSENRSQDIAQEALRMGAGGYVVKSDAATALLPAVEAVLKGQQFVSASVTTHVLTSPADEHAAGDPERNNVGRPALESSEIRRRHEIEFCPDDAYILDGFGRFTEAALSVGRAVIVIATESHRVSLFQKLMANGIDVDAAIEQKSYIPLDVADTLRTFMLNDWPDPVRFVKAARNLIMEAAKDAKGEGRYVSACGECAPSLLARGKVEAAIQLEHLWDEIARRYDVDILCGYTHCRNSGVWKAATSSNEFARSIRPFILGENRALKCHAALPFASRCNSVSVTVNSAKPQSKQTITCGNTHTVAFCRPSTPGK